MADLDLDAIRARLAATEDDAVNLHWRQVPEGTATVDGEGFRYCLVPACDGAPWAPDLRTDVAALLDEVERRIPRVPRLPFAMLPGGSDHDLRASTPIGEYRVVFYNGTAWGWQLRHPNGIGDGVLIVAYGGFRVEDAYPNRREAMDAANEDFEARVLDCLGKPKEQTNG